MYERHHEKLLPIRKFISRLTNNFLIGPAIIALSLVLGMAGYHGFEKMSWEDAYLNASMILSGMGPVTELNTLEGKIFAASYALFSGIIFLFVMAIIMTPIVHRFFHNFHMKEQ